MEHSIYIPMIFHVKDRGTNQETKISTTEWREQEVGNEKQIFYS